MSEYNQVTNRSIQSQRQTQARYLALVKTKKVYLRILLASTFILIASVVLFVMFFMKSNDISAQVKDYQELTAGVNKQIYEYEHNRLLNLSSSNIESISLDYKGTAVTAIDLSHNSIRQIDLIRFTSKLIYLDLTDNPIKIVSNLTLLATDEIRLPNGTVELRDSYFRYDKFPNEFNTLLNIENITIQGMQELILEKPNLDRFIYNRFPDTKKILLVNNYLYAFQIQSDVLQQLYIQSYNNQFITLIDSPCPNGITVEVAGQAQLLIYNAKVVDFSKIKILNLTIIKFVNTTIANFNSLNHPSLSSIQWQNVKGPSSLIIDNLNLKILQLKNTSFESIKFPSSFQKLTILAVRQGSITKIQNINATVQEIPSFIDNPNLKSFQSNILQYSSQIELSSSLVSIINNDLQRAEYIYSQINGRKMKFPNIQRVNGNYLSSLQNFYFASGKLSQCKKNIFYQVRYINLSNNNMSDEALKEFFLNSEWGRNIVQYLNIKNNPIKNYTDVVQAIYSKFPNIELDI